MRLFVPKTGEVSGEDLADLCSHNAIPMEEGFFKGLKESMVR